MDAGDGRQHLPSWPVTARRKYPPSTNRQSPTSLRSRPCQGAARLLRYAPSLRVTRPPAAAQRAVMAGRVPRPSRSTGPASASHLTNGRTAASVCIEARQTARRRWTGGGSCRSSPTSGPAAATRWEASDQVGRQVRIRADRRPRRRCNSPSRSKDRARPDSSPSS